MRRILLLLIGCSITLSQNCTNYDEIDKNPSDKYYREWIGMHLAYHFNFHDNYNFFEALEYCYYNGLQLVTMNTKYEECLFEKALKSRLGVHGNREMYLWIGGTSLGSNSWKWMPNGEKFAYTNWAPNQPDNESKNENCVEYMNPKKKWNDRDCNHHQWFVCEERCSRQTTPDKECLKKNGTFI